MANINPSKIFIRNDVLKILQRVTGFDLNKIFKSEFNVKLKNSEIKLLTSKQLEKENEKAIKTAKYLLQMPPFLTPRKRCDEILSVDERLNPLNLQKTNYVFVDISLNIPDHKRMIVVRESTGVLRKADHSEREKMLQVYFPIEGKSNYVPKMFEPENLEECLKVKNYMIILNKACLRFEPDDPEFIRITHRCYEFINEAGDHDDLHSTRFFGPLVFYLAWYKKLDNLLAYMLKKSRFEDCVDVIRLYSLMHAKEDSTANYIKNSKSDLKLVEMFINEELKNSEVVRSAYVNFVKENEKLKANKSA